MRRTGRRCGAARAFRCGRAGPRSPPGREAAPASHRPADRSAARSPGAVRTAASGSRLSLRAAELRALPALRVEIIGAEPALERRLARRPFAVEHGKPRIVAVAPLGDQVLAERAFVDEAIAQGGAARRCVERVAFPF